MKINAWTRLVAKVAPEVGSRIAVRTEGKIFYLATITKLLPSGLYRIKYDDTAVDSIEAETFIVVDPSAPHNPNPLKYSAVVALKKPAIQPAAPAKPKARPATPPPAVEDKPPTKEEPKEEPDTSEETKLCHIVGNAMFYKGIHDRSSMLRYMTLVWQKTNEHFFEGRLPTCNFLLMKDMGTKFRGLGKWSPSRNAIIASPRIFNASEAHCVSTIVHEQCHQAVTRLDRVAEGNGGHGPRWSAYMRHCGLTPSRYAMEDRTTYYTPEEKQKVEKLNTIRQEVAQTTERLYPSRGKPAKYLDSRTEKFLVGIIACPADKQGKKWAFASSTSGTQFSIVSYQSFFVLDELELAKVEANPGYAEMAKKIQMHYAMKNR